LGLFLFDAVGRNNYFIKGCNGCVLLRLRGAADAYSSHDKKFLFHVERKFKVTAFVRKKYAALFNAASEMEHSQSFRSEIVTLLAFHPKAK
jgi:hypothetical protein